MTPSVDPTLSPSDAAQAQQIIHLIQTHQFSNNQAFFAGISFLNPLPLSWKLTIYNFLMSLPFPTLPTWFLVVFFTVGPFILLVLVFLTFKYLFPLIKLLVSSLSSALLKTVRERIFLELTFPHNTSKSVYATEQLYKTIHTVAKRGRGMFSPKKTFSLEIVSDRNDGIKFILGVPPTDADVMCRTLLSYLPGLRVREVPDYLENKLFISGGEDGRTTESQNINRSLGVLEFTLSDDFVLPLENQKALSTHDSIAFLTGNMTKLEKGELVAFQLVTSPIVSDRKRSHIKEVQNAIYQGKPLSPAVFKNGIQGLFPSALLFVLIPALWLIVSAFKLLIHLPHLLLSPNGPQSRAFFASNPRSNLQEVLNPYEQELSGVVKEKLGGHLFETSIRILILANNEEEFDARQTGITSSFSQFASQYQALTQKKMPRTPFFYARAHQKRLKDFQERNLTDGSVLSSSELTDLYHFPNMDITKIEGLVKSRSNELPAPQSMKRDEADIDIIIGKNIYGGEELPVGLRRKDRRQHTYIVGKTGMGKSTIIEGMALQDIQNGKGVAVIDPHGDMVEHLLTVIPNERQSDVVYLNPFDKSFPTGLNILNPGTNYSDIEEEHRRIAGTVMSIFMKITPEKYWGQRMEHILRNSILTSLQIEPGVATPYISLLAIQKLLTDESYRKSVTANLSDVILKQFWEKEFKLFRKGQQGDVISPLTNKIGEFITDPLSRYILLQEKSSINISEIMDEGKILLVNLSKGNLGEERSAFFGTLITSLIQLATYARAQTPESKRRDFFVYIDEFQNFATPHFTELFSEARKYHVFFTPSHQNIAQIDDPQVSKVIKGNSGNFITLKGSPDDEQAMLPILAPEVEEGQIVNLAPYHFFMKITNEEGEDAFTGVTIPIDIKGNEKVKNDIIDYSRKHYATPREEVENQLERLLGVRSVRKRLGQKTAEKEPSKPTSKSKIGNKYKKIKAV